MFTGFPAVKESPQNSLNLIAAFSDRVRDSTAAIAATIVKTTHRPGLFRQQHYLVQKQTSYTKHNMLVL